MYRVEFTEDGGVRLNYANPSDSAPKNSFRPVFGEELRTIGACNRLNLIRLEIGIG